MFQKSIVVSGFFLAGTLATFCFTAPQPQAIAQAPKSDPKDSETERIRKDVAILKDKAPDQAHAMMDVEYHFANLWFAGKAENWPLAEFYWKEAVSHMKWAVRIIPVRKDNAGKEIKLEAILESILQSPWMQVGKTIEQQDVAEFEKAYKFTLGGCYNCHKASDKPYLRPQIPERPASSMINFDPKATWPQ
jgi:hypothetical protein